MNHRNPRNLAGIQGAETKIGRGIREMALHAEHEQADALSSHLRLSEDESDHFLLLVSHARAGSRELRKRFEVQLERARQSRAHIESRLKLKKILPAERQAIYYSAWHYSAIHVLLSIPAFQTQDAIVKRLQITPAQAARALEFLTEAGLAVHSKGRYQTGEVALHLQHDSPWTGRPQNPGRRN